MVDTPSQVELPPQLIKDRHVLTSALRAFATHLVSEASSSSKNIISLHFEREKVFQVSAMLFQLIVMAEDNSPD
jgi:hypothetical protein